jgi:outer membrane protein assembly factor BamB
MWLAALTAGLWLGTVVLQAADWPMWRYDSGRSAASPQMLAAELHLQWVREEPALEPAWPDEPKLHFDAAYEPIVVGQTLLYGSARNDCLKAVDTRSGQEKWRFYADGPIRFAPAAWQGNVYFACDDGYLYCLQADTGRLRWKFRGGPADRRVLGNGRLISAWPARGAPVVHEGVVYFAASIWPFMGIFVHAVDAETGRSVWVNDGSGAEYLTQPHNSPAFSGPTPQGYLAVAEDRLLLACGRSAPAGFDRTRGEFLYFHHGRYNKGYGGYQVVAWNRAFFNSGALFDADTGHIIDNFGGDPIVTPRELYVLRGGSLVGLDLVNAEVAETIDRLGNKQRVVKPKERWKLTLPSGYDQTLQLLAGTRLFATGPKGIVAIEIPEAGRSGGTPRLAWQQPTDAVPQRAVVADDRLFVCTRDGRIRCYGAQRIEPQRPAAQPAAADRPAPRPAGDAARAAAAILQQSGVQGGYCLVLGLTDGALAAELARQSALHVIAVDADAAKVAALRRRLDDAGLYGTRVAVHAGEPLEFRFPPYLAELIVSEDPPAAGIAAGPDALRRLFEPLRPYTGAAWLSLSDQQHAALAEVFATAQLPGGELTRRGAFTVLRRSGPLPGAGCWTHQYGDVANTSVSADSLVRAPLGLLWFGGASNQDVLPRHGHGPQPQVVAGRLIIEGPDSLRATDVYTGRVLWKTDLPGVGKPYNNTAHQPGANAIGSNYVSLADAVYVAYGEGCLRLDPADGQVVAEFRVPPLEQGAAAPEWGFVGVYEDWLIAGLQPLVLAGDRVGTHTHDGTSSRQIAVLDRHSGRLLWRREAVFGFRHNTIVAGGGKVFAIDMLPDAVLALLRRRGEVPSVGPRLLALDVRTGQIAWSTDRNVFGTWLGYSAAHDILLQAGRPSRDMLRDEPGNRMIAHRGATGDVVWDKDHRYSGPCMLHGETIITQGTAYHLRTGEPVLRENPLTGAKAPWQFTRNYGCTTAIASQCLLTFRSAAAGFFDLSGDGGTGNLGGFRSGCTANLIVADGVLSAPDYTRTCTCSYQNQTSLALVHMPEAEMWTFNSFDLGKEPVRRLGINLGAPGDRRDASGTLWLEFPYVGGPSPQVPVRLDPEQPQRFRRHASNVSGEGLPWVAASGLRGLREIRVELGTQQPRRYTLRLHFAEPDDVPPGARVFDVLVQGRVAIPQLDVVQASGGRLRGLVHEVRDVEISRELVVAFKPRPGCEAILCGLELLAEDR